MAASKSLSFLPPSLTAFLNKMPSVKSESSQAEKETVACIYSLRLLAGFYRRMAWDFVYHML